MWLKDVVLESNSVKLIPLKMEHAPELVAAAADGELWKLWYTSVPNSESVEDYIQQALDAQAQGLALPFAVVDKTSDKIMGSTRFCHADPANKRVEIGYTWYASRYHRTSVNTQCKQLLLTHAFERLNVIAVEFRTHWMNHKSRAAIARLGAKQDGVLRNHQKVNGIYRDTVVFSIIESEWPAVKAHLAYSQQR